MLCALGWEGGGWFAAVRRGGKEAGMTARGQARWPTSTQSEAVHSHAPGGGCGRGFSSGARVVVRCGFGRPLFHPRVSDR